MRLPPGSPIVVVDEPQGLVVGGDPARDGMALSVRLRATGAVARSSAAAVAADLVGSGASRDAA
jgi:hypothetical protein